MNKTCEWHVRSNGIGFIVMDLYTNVIAEFHSEATANEVVRMRHQSIGLRRQIMELQRNARLLIKSDEGGQPRCTCCGQPLKAGAEGHRSNCLVQGVLRLEIG